MSGTLFRISYSVILITAVFSVIAISNIELAHAIPISPLSGTPSTVSVNAYANTLFTFALGISAVLAVLMITIGGVRYTLSAVSPSEKSAAKEMIKNAISGLIIVFAAWLILNTIDPTLV